MAPADRGQPGSAHTDYLYRIAKFLVTVSIGTLCSCAFLTRGNLRPTGNTREEEIGREHQVYLVPYSSSVDKNGNARLTFDVRKSSICAIDVEGSRKYSRISATGDLLLGIGLLYGAVRLNEKYDCFGERKSDLCDLRDWTVLAAIGELALGFSVWTDPTLWQKPDWEQKGTKRCSDFKGVDSLQYVSDVGTRELERKTLNNDEAGYDLIIPLAEIFSARVQISEYRIRAVLPLYQHFSDLARGKQQPALTVTGVRFNGGNNQALDAHESGDLAVTLENRGQGDAFVRASLTPRHMVAGVKIETPTQVLRVPAKDTLVLTLPVIATGDIYDSQFTAMLAVADVFGSSQIQIPLEFRTRRERLPRIAFSGVLVDDRKRGQTSGNGNGRLDSGEEAILTLSFINTGEAPADDLAFDIVGTREVNVVQIFPLKGCRSLDVGATLQVQALVNVSKRYDSEGPLPLRYRLAAKPGILLDDLLPLSLAEEVRPLVYKPVPAPDPEIEHHCPK